MTYEEYRQRYGKQDHVLICLTDTPPYFKEKRIVKNGTEWVETNYHIHNGTFSTYINYEMPDEMEMVASAEISGSPRFEICGREDTLIFITNVSDEQIEVELDPSLMGFEARPGKVFKGEVFAIYPKAPAEETRSIFEQRALKSENGFISQAEIIRLLGGGE